MQFYLVSSFTDKRNFLRLLSEEKYILARNLSVPTNDGNLDGDQVSDSSCVKIG